MVGAPGWSPVPCAGPPGFAEALARSARVADDAEPDSVSVGLAEENDAGQIQGRKYLNG